MGTDWGTFVSDSKGVLHNVALNSFDTLSASMREPLNSTSEALRTKFDATYKKYKDKISDTLGLDPEQGLSLENISKSISEMLGDTGIRMGAEAVLGFAAKQVAELEGPLGLLLSEAVSIATGEFAKFLATGDVDYKPGQWVFIDYGSQTTRQINENPKVIELNQESSIWSSSDITIVPDELDYSQTAKHAIGFVLGRQPWEYEYRVFSFLNGKEEDINTKNLRPCPETFAARLDNDENFSAVREIKFLKDHDPTLKTYIPTEIGDTVVLGDQNCKIIEQRGEEWVVETPSGLHISVHESDLLPGRTESNTRWDRENIDLGTFTSILPDAIYSGEWVWVPANDLLKKITNRRRLRQQPIPDELKALGPQNKVLALVTSVEGKTVHVVRAFDGEPLDVSQEVVVGTTNGLQKTMSQQSGMGSWRQNVLEGYDPHVRPPGEIHPMLTLGMGEMDDEQVRALQMAPAAKILGSTEVRGDGIVRTSMGEAGKVDLRAKIDVEDEQAHNSFINRERPGGVEVVQFTESSYAEGNGGMLMLVIGAAIVLYMIN
tara:strand:+ start:1234 stop:2874 length:1641 start_codon:yes stop_codon:yes gene_type:complete